MQTLRTGQEQGSPHHDASLGGVSKFDTDNMFMGEDGTPITILAGYDGMTRAFFANVVPCKGTSHACAEKSACTQRVVHKSPESGTAERSRTECHRRQTQKLERNIPIEIVSEQSRVGDSNASRPFKDRSVRSRITPNDRSVRRLVSTAQS